MTRAVDYFFFRNDTLLDSELGFVLFRERWTRRYLLDDQVQ